MLASVEFRNSERMSRFLRHVVEVALAGNESQLKESTVGVAVFDRDPAYNPKTDPVVRSEARRLREKIQRYYEHEGAGDRVRIDLPKGGYIVSFAFVEPAVTVLPPPAPPAPGRQIPRVAWVAMGLLLGALPLLVWNRTEASPESWQPREVYPLTSLPGQELDATLSPDGKQVAFVWDKGVGDFDLYHLPSTGGEAQQLTATQHRDLHPAYSPDGRTIAFLRTSPAGMEVWRIGADGSRAAKLTEIRWFEWFNWRSDLLLSTGYPGPAWTPDGRTLILSDVAGAQQGAALWEFDIATGSRRQISRPAKLSHDFYPAVSPDGRHVAFARQASASVCDLYLVERATGTERRLTHDSQDIHGLAWTPDSRALVYSTLRSGAMQLWRFPLDGGRQEPVAAPGDRAMGPAISRDGRLLVYTNATINTNLWRYRLDGREPPRPLIVSTGQNLFPRYSPDGARIAWASDRTSAWEIWVADAGGNGQKQLTHFASRFGKRLLGTPRWSPDGRWIAFDARAAENCAIYLIAAGGGEPRLLEANGWEERNPSFSRDGQWIYFNSNRGGTVQIWKRRVSGGEAVRVTSRRGYDAHESQDGRALYFLPAVAEPGIWRAAYGQESVLLPTIPFLARRHWDVAGERIYFLGHDAEPRTLMRFDVERSRLERILVLQGDLIADINSLTVSPDEQWVTVARPDILKSDLVAAVLR